MSQDHGVLARQRRELVGCVFETETRVRRQIGSHACAEFGMRVEAGAHCRATHRELAETTQACL